MRATPNSPRNPRRAERPGLFAAVLTGALLVLTACAGGAPIRYFTLEAVPPPVATPNELARPSPVYAGPPLAVQSVQVPPLLDRAEIPRRLGPGEFAISDDNHWAAPLGRMARQTLTEDLALRLPVERVLFPGSPWREAHAAVAVDVLSFKVMNGAAVMLLSWSVKWPESTLGAPTGPEVTPPPAPKRNPRVVSMRLESPAGDDAASAARAWSEMLAQVADRIVADLSAP